MGAGAGWSLDSGCQAGGSFENAPVFLLYLPRPRGWPVQLGAVCLRRDLSRPGTGQEGARPTPEFFCPPFRALCGGMKERVKSSMHMAPLFTMIKEGGHYLSLGSLLNTLWCH